MSKGLSFLLISICFLSMVFGNAVYYRCEDEPITPLPQRDRSAINTLQVGYVGIFEDSIGDHIHWLLNDILFQIERPVRVQSEGVLDLRKWRHSNSILITHSPLNWYFEWLKENNLLHLNISIIHLGDEGCNQNVDYYQYAPFVWRNYYCEDIFKQFANVNFLPLGYQTQPDELSRTALPIRTRSYDFNFVGLNSPDREIIENLLENYGILENYPCNFVIQPISYSQKRFFYMRRELYNGYLLHSILGLIPGNSTKAPGNETGRFYETMESGGIPVACKCHP